MYLYGKVALRKESVDRNMAKLLSIECSYVALRKESVDRNRTPHHRKTKPIPSLSARRAWIEIYLEEGKSEPEKSLSARRAWIEISMWCNAGKPWAVALRKESVDRNIKDDVSYNIKESRSPQGERG